MGTMTVYPGMSATDFYGQIRLQGRGIDIGAAEYQDPTVRTVTARAGENHRIIQGSSVEIESSGGTEYLWNTGETTRTITVNPTITTTYTVTVNEWEAVSIDNITVFVEDGQPAPIAQANAGNDFTILAGSSVTLTTIGTATATYLWSNGEITQTITVSPNTTTLYTVTVSESGSTATDSVIIYVNNN